MRRLLPVVPLFAILAAVVGAAAWLGWSSYHASRELVRRAEHAQKADNLAFGRKVIDRVEALIIDTDRTLFNLVNLDSPREFTNLWRSLIKVSPALEAAIVLDEERRIAHLLSKGTRHEERRLREFFEERVLPDLNLEGLLPRDHRHLHKEYDGTYWLLSYTRRESGDRTYYVVLKASLPYLIGNFIRKEVEPLAGRRRVEMLDEQGRRVFGEPVADGPELFADRFPTTLYLWTLRMAPRRPELVEAPADDKRVREVALIGLSVAVTVAGALALAWAIRRERRVSAMKSDFIANVSHELKTPLALVRMFGELVALGRAQDQEKIRRYGEVITRESERLTHLIDGLLDFARLERGQKPVYEFKDVDLREVVEAGLELFRYRLERANVRLRTEIDEDVPTVRADENAMTLVLLNLVDNAVKYGGEGGEVGVRVSRENGQVTLSVSDRGPGIPPSERRRIFERFYRSPAARASARGGTGIGLSLVQSIAQAHGGRVTVASEVGRGSSFSFSLPANHRAGGDA